MRSTITGIIAAAAVIAAFVAGTQIEFDEDTAAEEISETVEDIAGS